ncbi:MAG: LuxR C-terminal-related transcriptional regulator [Planctomycetia bacterium]|nr:LuxR C-terminal-related transcriptional regulator [Planctomycetia bacterium]
MTGFKIIMNNSLNSLMYQCVQGEGCVVIVGEGFSNEEILQNVHLLRKEGVSHGVIVVDSLPTIERATAFLKSSVCDYLQLNSGFDVYMSSLNLAMNWGREQGRRVVARYALRRNWSHLDEKMKEVLLLLYQGKTNREIAQALDISPRTVENRRAKLLDFFHVNSFAELIRVATQVVDEDVLPPSVWLPCASIAEEQEVTRECWLAVQKAVVRIGESNK